MWVVFVLALLGIVVSTVSLQHHYATSKTAYCEIGEAFDCDVVNRSEYSSILGIPVALIGMLGYAALAGLATAYRGRRETPALLFGGAAVGLVFALYLTYVEGHILGVWCILCLSSLGLIAASTVVSGLIWWSDKRSG
jgi:vitamin-K-epoxide reductase (warfarin-sensitive)